MRLALLFLTSLSLLSANCGTQAPARQTKNSTVSNSIVAAVDSVFDVNTICSLATKAATGTKLEGVSGGSWTKDGVVNEDWDYSCSGDKQIYLLEDAVGIVVVNYGTIGDKTHVKYISVEYTASYHGGLDDGEKKLRNEYVEFIESLSKQLFGQPLPSKVKTDLMGRKEFHKKDTGTAVGSGYINYLISSPLAKAIDIDVKFFGSKAEYEKFKDE